MDLLINFILIAGIVVTSLILILLFKSKKETPKKYLIAFFGMILLFLINVYSDLHTIKLSYYLTYIVNDVIELCVGPILFLYIQSIFEDEPFLPKRHWWHFIPAIVFILFISIPILVSIAQEEFVFEYLNFLNDQRHWIFNLIIIFLIVYTVVSLQSFYQYHRAIKGEFSNLQKSDIGWIARMLWGVLIVSLIDFFMGVYGIFYDAELLNDVVTLFSVIILVFFLGYYGVNQSKILLPKFLIQHPYSEDKTNAKSITTLSSEEFETIEKKLQKVMESQEPYLDEELTLTKLADLIGTSNKKLSMLLNQHLHTSFYDYINKHRIEEVKRKIHSSKFENLTLLGIAFDSGFNSKTSFNRIFKKETGLSPSQYKKSLK